MLRRLLIVLPIYAVILLVGMFWHYSDTDRIAENVVFAAEKAKESAQNTAESAPEVYEGIPVELYIPRLDLALPVVDGTYNPISQTWTLSSNKAHFAHETNKLNNISGLSLIFGHNNKNVFSKTSDLVTGDLIEIKTDTMLIFTYTFVSDSIVEPQDTSLFAYEGKPRLSLLTCTGQWFEQRRIMNFDLLSVRPLEQL